MSLSQNEKSAKVERTDGLGNLTAFFKKMDGVESSQFGHKI